MEYIRVKFPEDRLVYVNGQQCGRTNRKFRIEKGTHTINLGDPRNYEPNWRRPTVEDTTPTNPMIVTFDEVKP